MHWMIPEVMWHAAVAQGAPPPDLWAKLLETMSIQSWATFVLAFLAVLVVTKVGFVAMSLWLFTLFPDLGKRALGRYQAHGTRCVLVGLVNGLVGTTLVVLMIKSEVLALPGILLMLLMAAGVVFAYGVAYRHLGERMSHRLDPAGLRTHVLGGLAAEGAFCLPVLGQLMSLSVMFRGFGAVILAALTARSAARARRATPLVQESPN